MHVRWSRGDELSWSPFGSLHSSGTVTAAPAGLAAAEAMRPGGRGRLIAISSVGACTGGMSQSAVYSAAKAGELLFGETSVRFPLDVSIVECYADAA